MCEVNSSVEGREFLKNIGVPRGKRRGILDSYAALLLLKEFLDSGKKEVLVGF